LREVAPNVQNWTLDERTLAKIDGAVDAAETITFDLKNTVSWDFASTTPTFDDTTETMDDANDGGWTLGDAISVTVTITDND